MRNSKVIKGQEIIDFIKSQPDDREVDFREYNSDYTCGCVMVHYAKDVLNLPNVNCGLRTFFTNNDGDYTKVAVLNTCIDDIVCHKVWSGNRKHTYGEVKRLMGLT